MELRPKLGPGHGGASPRGGAPGHVGAESRAGRRHEQAEGQAGPSAPPAHPVIKRHDFLTTPMKRLSDGAALCHLTLRITHRGPTRGRAPSPGTLLTTAVPLGPPGSLAPGRPQPVPAASVSAALQGAPHAESPAATPPAGPGTRSCPPSSQADGDAEVRGGPRPGRAAGPFPRDWNPAPVPSLRWCGVPGTVHSGLRVAWEDAVASPPRSAALMPWALGHCRDIDTQGAPCVSERPPPQLPRGRTCTVTPGKRLPESPPSC